MNILKQFAIVNGLYDMLCALCLLKIINISILNKLHLSMFINEPTDQEKRWIAYWIFTYGIIRLIANNKYLFINKFIYIMHYL